MKKLLILIPFIGMSQVGINTENPTAMLEVNGDVKIKSILEGSKEHKILVVDNEGLIRQIALKELISNENVKIHNCPKIEQKSGYYLLFKSDASIPSPNKALTIDGKLFASAGTWIENNTYYYSYTNTTGQPLNLNKFNVDFNGLSCEF